MSVYRRILRDADGTHPHWVKLEEDKCVGESFHALRKFCEERDLSLSRHGYSVACEGFFQVSMFAEEEHAAIFREAFGGERIHRSEGEKKRGGRSGQRRQSTEARLAGVHAHLTGFVAVPFILLGIRSGFALGRMQNALSPRGNIVMPEFFE